MHIIKQQISQRFRAHLGTWRGLSEMLFTCNIKRPIEELIPCNKSRETARASSSVQSPIFCTAVQVKMSAGSTWLPPVPASHSAKSLGLNLVFPSGFYVQAWLPRSVNAQDISLPGYLRLISLSYIHNKISKVRNFADETVHVNAGMQMRWK